MGVSHPWASAQDGEEARQASLGLRNWAWPQGGPKGLEEGDSSSSCVPAPTGGDGGSAAMGRAFGEVARWGTTRSGEGEAGAAGSGSAGPLA